MKFKMYFGKIKTALFAMVMIIALALIVVDILLLSHVFGNAVNEVVAGVSMGAGALIFVGCALTLFYSNYELKDDHLKCVLAVFCDKIKYESIAGIRQNTVTKEVFVAVEDDKGDVFVSSLNLDPATADKMARELACKCGMLVEYYSPKTDKKK